MLSLPTEVTPTNFVVLQGEALPLRIIVPNDGNGTALESIQDFDFEIVVKDARVAADSSCGCSCDDGEIASGPALLTIATPSPRLVKFGTSLTWSFSADELLALPAICVYYVLISSSGYDKSVIAGGTITILKQ